MPVCASVRAYVCVCVCARHTYAGPICVPIHRTFLMHILYYV